MIRLIKSRLLQSTWVVKNNVMCAIFWAGIIVVFMGMILLVTSKHKGQVFKSWGSVVTGFGFCVIIVCVLLCIHSYLVSANSMRAEEEFNSLRTNLRNLKTTAINTTRINGSSPTHSKVRKPPKFKNPKHTFPQLNNSHAPQYIKQDSIPDQHTLPPMGDEFVGLPCGDDASNINVHPNKTSKHSKSIPPLNEHIINSAHHIVNYLPKEETSKLSITRNFGTSTITVTPLYHKNYLQVFDDDQVTHAPYDMESDNLTSVNYNNIESGHLISTPINDNIECRHLTSKNECTLTPIYPDTNDTNHNNLPALSEIADSKATVYENVQYYNM